MPLLVNSPPSTYSEKFIQACKTTAEIKDIFGVHRNTILNWITHQNLPVIKMGGRRYHHWPSVQEWLKNQNKAEA